MFCIERNSFEKCISSYFFYKKLHNYNKDFLTFLNGPTLIPMDWGRYTMNNNIIGHVYRYEKFHKILESLNFFLKLKK